jgi:DNA replication licensing factor MCM6
LQLSEEAREYLVTQYRNLRQADASGVGKSSYRITVRQLESMVRLSEALAKLNGVDEVLVHHATEAAYLLKTSIVHVEQDSIDLDQDELPNQSNEGEEMAAEEVMQDDNLPVAKQKITLSAEEYAKIVQSVLLQIKRKEHSSGVAGMTKSALINWYLESLEQNNAIETEEAYLYQRKVIKSVLTRLVKQVYIF